MTKISSNQIISCTALALAVAAVVCCGFCKKSPKIGLLNSQRVFAEADVFRRLNADQAKYVDAMLARQNEDEKMLQKELTQLQNKIQSSQLGEKAFAKEIAAFREKVVAYNLKYRQQQALIAHAGNVARQQVESFVQATFTEFGNAGYSVIMPKSVTYYSKPCLDITNDFIKRLNAKDISVTFPDPALFLKAVSSQQAAPVANTVAPAKSAAIQSSQPADKNAAQPADKNAVKPADENAVQPTDKNTVKPADKNAVQTTDKNAVKPADKNAAQLADKNAVKPANKNATQSTKNAAKPAEKK